MNAREESYILKEQNICHGVGAGQEMREKKEILF